MGDAGSRRQALHPNAPNGWKDILLVLDYADSTLDWTKIVATILGAKYEVEKVNDIPPAQRQVVGRRLANMAAYLTDVVMEGNEFPPPNEAEVVGAIQWAFEGLTLEPPFPEVEHEVIEPTDSDAALDAEQSAAMMSAEEAQIEFGPEEGQTDDDAVETGGGEEA